MRNSQGWQDRPPTTQERDCNSPIIVAEITATPMSPQYVGYNGNSSVEEHPVNVSPLRQYRNPSPNIENTYSNHESVNVYPNRTSPVLQGSINYSFEGNYPEESPLRQYRNPSPPIGHTYPEDRTANIYPDRMSPVFPSTENSSFEDSSVQGSLLQRYRNPSPPTRYINYHEESTHSHGNNSTFQSGDDPVNESSYRLHRNPSPPRQPSPLDDQSTSSCSTCSVSVIIEISIYHNQSFLPVIFLKIYFYIT